MRPLFKGIMKGGIYLFNSYEKSLIQQGLNLLRLETESTLKRQRETYQGINDGLELIAGNEELLQEIKELKNKLLKGV
jgi:hypothetical protein